MLVVAMLVVATIVLLVQAWILLFIDFFEFYYFWVMLDWDVDVPLLENFDEWFKVVYILVFIYFYWGYDRDSDLY